MGALLVDAIHASATGMRLWLVQILDQRSRRNLYHCR